MNNQSGQVLLMVEDNEGRTVPDAAIYITDGLRTQMVLSDAHGTAQVTLPSGRYLVSSSMTRPSSDYVDRFASHKATIEIAPGDTTSIVLNLVPLSNHVSDISLSTLRKMGVDTELAKYSN